MIAEIDGLLEKEQEKPAADTGRRQRNRRCAAPAPAPRRRRPRPCSLPRHPSPLPPPRPSRRATAGGCGARSARSLLAVRSRRSYSRRAAPRPSMTARSQRFVADPGRMRPFRSRWQRLAPAWVLLVAAAGCGKTTQLESGAVLLDLSVGSGVTTPDELRLSVYDDAGALWNDTRVPASGALVPESATHLGTVLIQPGAAPGRAARARARPRRLGARRRRRAHDSGGFTRHVRAAARRRGARRRRRRRRPRSDSTTARRSRIPNQGGCPGTNDAGDGGTRATPATRRRRQHPTTAGRTMSVAAAWTPSAARLPARATGPTARPAPTACSARRASASTASAARTPASARAARAISPTTTASASPTRRGRIPPASARAARPATARARAARRRAGPRRTASCAAAARTARPASARTASAATARATAPASTCETGTCANVTRKPDPPECTAR